MKIFKMDLKKAEELALKYGFKPAPKDHPIYREGISITFVRNEQFPKRKKQKLNSF
jgi:hypothetical protein